MVRAVALAVLALAPAGCAADERRDYVIRLDLDEIAARTARRDASPGFETLAGDAGAQSRPPLGIDR